MASRTINKHLWGVLFLALALLAGLPSAAWADAGDLDPSFGQAGKVITPVGRRAQETHAVALQPDGKILVAGSGTSDLFVARYHADGNLDLTFGRAGKALTDFKGTLDVAQAVAVQPDGKIVTAGWVDKGVGTYTGHDLALLRSNADGSPDETFGVHGEVVTDLNGEQDEAYGLALLPDGKILVAGPGGGGFAVARYNPDGSPDTEFDGDGWAVAYLGNAGLRAYGLALQADGKILVSGTYQKQWALVRFAPDGSLDAAFGSGGVVLTPGECQYDCGRAVAVQPNGKILVAGQEGTDVALVRYNSSGALDSSFGASGLLRTDLGSNADLATALQLQPDGKILVAGATNTTHGDDYVVLRYRRDGNLDPGFGSGGIVTTDFAGRADRASALALQPDARIVLAGNATPKGETTFDIGLARYDTGGDLDADFGREGRVSTNLGLASDLARAVALQPDGKILAAGYTGSSGADDFALVRYRKDGSLDPTFGRDGKVITPLYGSWVDAQAVVVQPDGRILLAGYNGIYEDRDVAVVRYNPDGSLDATFGTGGKVSTDLADDKGYDLALQDDGRILVAGSSGDSSGVDFCLLRYLPDGRLDPTFGTAGHVLTDFFSRGDRAQAVALLPNGSIVAAGWASTNGGVDFAVARYLPDGSLDHSFGNNGKVTQDLTGSTPTEWSDTGEGMVLLPDGRILVAGLAGSSIHSRLGLVRFNSDGSLDTTFGQDGQLLTGLGLDNAVAQAVSLQADGRILVAGSGTLSGERGFLLARFQADGSVDASFGQDGRVLTGFGGRDDWGVSLALQPDGWAVVAGSTQIDDPDYDFALARYEIAPSYSVRLPWLGRQ